MRAAHWAIESPEPAPAHSKIACRRHSAWRQTSRRRHRKTCGSSSASARGSNAKPRPRKCASLGQLAAGVAHDFKQSSPGLSGHAFAPAQCHGRKKQTAQPAGNRKPPRSMRPRPCAHQTFARRAPSEQLSFISVAKLIIDAIQLTRTRWKMTRARTVCTIISGSRPYEAETRSRRAFGNARGARQLIFTARRDARRRSD